MPSLHVRQFEARYRLPRSAVAEGERLDKILSVVLGEALERALEEVGLPDGVEVCIEVLYVPVRLRLAGTEASLARLWGRALAEAIRRAADGGQVRGVVCYPSRAHALIDFATGVAAGDLGRAWAWGQLGLCRPRARLGDHEAGGDLVKALIAEPSAVIPTLVALAEARLLARLARRLAADQWSALAGAALRGVGASPEIGRPETLSERGTDFQSVLRRERYAARLVARSRLAEAFHGSLAAIAELRPALAALVIAEADPAALAVAGSGRSLVAAVASQLCHPARAVAGDTTDAEEGGAGRTAVTDGAGEEAPASLAETPEHREEAEAGPEPEPDWVVDGATPSPVLRKHSRTRFGGLLFLCGVVEDLELPVDIARSVAETGRTVRWALHRLDLRLVPAEADDPAVLAFCGLPPTAEPPSADADPPTDEEEAVVASWAARILARLRDLLDRHDEPATELLRFVCHRPAEVVADPGWIEVRFALQDVSTKVRRAGLDLDPGYVPWLGVVLKFVYQ